MNGWVGLLAAKRQTKGAQEFSYPVTTSDNTTAFISLSQPSKDQ